MVFKNDDFEKIFWHDSVLVSIHFDLLTNSVKLFIDLVHSQDGNGTRFQPSVVKFSSVSKLSINLKWNDVFVFPEINNVERRIIDKPLIVESGLIYYEYRFHFNIPENGTIILPMITEFELHTLCEPIFVVSEESYIKQRQEIIKQNIEYVVTI